MDIRHYLTASGKDPYQQWLDELKDLRGRVVIQRRIDRVANGNFGNHKFCQDGVWELRIHFGPGYRVYYGREGETVIVLLCGGSKRAQSADSRTQSVIGSTTSGGKNESEIKISSIP